MNGLKPPKLEIFHYDATKIRFYFFQTNLFQKNFPAREGVDGFIVENRICHSFYPHAEGACPACGRSPVLVRMVCFCCGDLPQTGLFQSRQVGAEVPDGAVTRTRRFLCVWKNTLPGQCPLSSGWAIYVNKKKKIVIFAAANHWRWQPCLLNRCQGELWWQRMILWNKPWVSSFWTPAFSLLYDNSF